MPAVHSRDASASGWGIQVVVPRPGHTFTLNEEALSALLLREDVRNLPVVVITVAGAFRKGKSFLLGYFLRYMYHKYGSEEIEGEWLGLDERPLTGFKWRGGSERETTGLLLWSEPFKATLPNGEKLPLLGNSYMVVILIMDTQGTFDSESTVKDNATVFALSTMISSVQIYNLSQNIEEDDLQHLQLFTDYGTLVKENSIGKPFQKLLFLIRDWSYPYDYPYGVEGGQRYLAKNLQIEKRQHEELRNLRTYITSVFDEISCFLMPHPGLKVATNPEFNGRLADISDEFKEELKKLVPMILAPENLVLKLIEGQLVKAKDLLHYFKTYMEVFTGNELPEPKSILEATAEANNLSASADAQDVYKKLMEMVCGGMQSYLKPQKLEEEHMRIKNKALHVFDSKKKLGGEMRAKFYKQKLELELEELYEQYKAHNESKSVCKMIRTPAVFLMLVLIGLVVWEGFRFLGERQIAWIGLGVLIVALLMFVVWVYVKITGKMRGIGAMLDNLANYVWKFYKYLKSLARRRGTIRTLPLVFNETEIDGVEDKKQL